MKSGAGPIAFDDGGRWGDRISGSAPPSTDDTKCEKWGTVCFFSGPGADGAVILVAKAPNLPPTSQRPLSEAGGPSSTRQLPRGSRLRSEIGRDTGWTRARQRTGWTTSFISFVGITLQMDHTGRYSVQMPCPVCILHGAVFSHSLSPSVLPEDLRLFIHRLANSTDHCPTGDWRRGNG